MSSTLFRLGLWVILLVIAAYVMHETFEDAPTAEFFAPAMLSKALALGGILVLAGGIARLLERGAKAVVKNRCATCRTAIPPGAIYCREHLRSVLRREEDREHMTRIRR